MVLEKNDQRQTERPTDLRSQLVLVLEGSCWDLVAYASAEVHGDVQGGATVSGGLQVRGNVTGDVVTSGGTFIHGSVEGDINRDVDGNRNIDL